MNEIEKLYENAGIEPEQQDCCKIADKYWACNTESGFEYLMQKECPYNQECTDECEYAYDKIVYPPFTAEKQLLLIQWLAKTRPIHITYLIDRWTIEGMVRYGICYDTFEDALSGYINQIWQDLTDAEKAEIKNILEM